MDKIKLAVIFGGISTEHQVSISSGTSVIENLDKDKYEIFPTYIDQNGNWYEYKKQIKDIHVLAVGEQIEEIEKIENIVAYLKHMQVVFPVLHGLGGEDGTIQGLFEMIQIPYVGCGVLSSSVGMDKVYTKIIFEKAQIPQTKYEYIKKEKEKYQYVHKDFSEEECTLQQLGEKIEKKLSYPMFVKPSNSGSSVGVKKAESLEELKKAIENAAIYDTKILVEQGVIGREIECAVLGNEDLETSSVGEVLAAEEFYSFDAKYKNQESKTVIPADISKEISNTIRDYAVKAFKAIDAKGLSRVDFFVENKTNQIYINEINTLPGFTSISMYPKLFEQIGLNYSKLLDELIDLAMENRKQ